MAGPSPEPPPLGLPPPPSLTEFDPSSVPSFYLCRICEAHIADPREIVCTEIDNILVFRHAINSINSVNPSRRTSLDVRCIRCNEILGYTLNLEIPPFLGNILRDGQVLLYLTSLWLWDGQYTIDPVTGEVVPPRQQPPPLSPPSSPPLSPWHQHRL